VQYHIIHAGTGVPHAVVRGQVDRGQRSEEAFTRDLEWVKTDLLSQVPVQQHWTADEVSLDDGLRHAFLIALRVRQEWQRTEWVGEYEYFAVLKSERDELMRHAVSALVRRRAGTQELLGADGAWQVTEQRLTEMTCLPISEAEHDRLRWTVAKTRWFVLTTVPKRRLFVRTKTEPYPVAVIRMIPAAEEAYTRNPRWEPSDLLGQSGLRVEEVSDERRADEHRFAIQTGVREARQRTEWAGEYEYFMITPGPLPRFDIAQTSSRGSPRRSRGRGTS